MVYKASGLVEVAVTNLTAKTGEFRRIAEPYGACSVVCFQCLPLVVAGISFYLWWRFPKSWATIYF